MYAGEAEKQLSSLAQINQQRASEEFNRKMQALNVYNALTGTGDKRRGEAYKDMTRSGLLGMGANIVDLLKGDNGNRKLNITNSLMQVQSGDPDQAKSPTGKPLIDALTKREYGGTDAVQGELLNRLIDPKSPDYNPQQFELMTRQSQMSPDAGGVKGVMSRQTDTMEQSQQVTDMQNKMQKADYYKGVNDVIDKDVSKQNKQIEAQNLKAQKEFEAQERKDPIGGFINYAKDKGLNIPTQFEGDKDDQRKQNYDLHNAQIEYFLSKGRKDLARKAESEWIQNEMNIDKSWGDDGKKDYRSLWNINGPAKEAQIEKFIAVKPEGSDDFIEVSLQGLPKSFMDMKEDQQANHMSKKLGYNIKGVRVNNSQDENAKTILDENKSADFVSRGKGVTGSDGKLYYKHNGQYRVEAGVDDKGNPKHAVVDEKTFIANTNGNDNSNIANVKKPEDNNGNIILEGGVYKVKSKNGSFITLTPDKVAILKQQGIIKNE